MAGAGARDRVHARTRPHAGFHRRARGRRPGGDAECGGAWGRRSGAREPARSGRPHHRPFRPGRSVPFARCVRSQHRLGVPAERGALRPAPVGATGLRQRPRGSAGRGDLPSGEPGASRTCGRVQGRGRVPRHTRGHGFPYDHGQRARRARLGGGWHRGRGGDARTADLPFATARARGSCRGFPSCRYHGYRPGPEADADAPSTRSGRDVRRVLRRRVVFIVGGRPGDVVEHVSRIRGHFRILPGRPRDPSLPHLHGSR